ncbi:MAG TPA: DUF2914 domain-containing protein [Gammaproteobacteria bacterium]|nr:DUF2914 domain-containing protein [Gammaproteobacteria bacterium]
MQKLLPAILLPLICMTAPYAGETRVSPVSRAVFTTAIEQAEPVDSLGVLQSGAEQVYLFTELRGMKGEVLVHTWEHKGAVIARIPFHVGQPDARVWSGRLLTPDMQGSWRVVITNAAGTILVEKTLDYNPDDLPF